MFYHLLRKKAKPVLAAEQDAQDYESLFSDKPAKKKKKSSAKKEAAASESAAEPITEAPAKDEADAAEQSLAENNENTEAK